MALSERLAWGLPYEATAQLKRSYLSIIMQSQDDNAIRQSSLHIPMVADIFIGIHGIVKNITSAHIRAGDSKSILYPIVLLLK